MVKQVLAWDSPLSFWMDITLGVLPVAFFSVYGLIAVILGMAMIFNTDPATELQNRLWIVLITVTSSLGLVSSLSLVYSSFARGHIKQKRMVIIGLIALICFSSVLMLGSLSNIIETRPPGSTPFLIISVAAIVLITIKHIIMLTRA
jgi:drug/metabolite transporter (DMT)-like permease